MTVSVAPISDPAVAARQGGGARAPASPLPAYREEVARHKRRFQLLNRERLRRVRESLTEKQRTFIDLLPLLYHTNHPLMPGYVGKDTPHGVSEYVPDKRTLNKAVKLVKSFPLKRQVVKRIDIHALFLMGSSGTVAHSTQSDFDIWVCHRPDLDGDQRQDLEKKGQKISHWAESLGLEAHFFLMSPERFRAGDDAGAMTSEDSGTAQHHLLLDEFYRTGLLVTGRYPIWWLVPPEQESNYANYVDGLNHKRFVRAEEYIDFGPVANVPPEEFFGAALWQLFKGIGSPHKSVLKILLLESYAKDYPRADILSLRFKRAVYEGETNLDVLDPYVLLARKVEEYLESLGDRERLELARRCFYFKVNEPLSLSRRTRTADWRRELIQELITHWGWGAGMLQNLDARETWKIDRVLQERKSLVNALTQSYRLLSRFAREHADVAMVSERDMTILGRKLFAVFENKAGKVDIVNQGISQDLSEGYLHIRRARARDDQEYWLLYRGAAIGRKDAEAVLLKRAWTLVELLAWCHFNGLLARHTRVHLDNGGSGPSHREIDGIREHLRREYPPSLTKGADVDALASQPRMAAASVFVNLGVDPLASYTRRGRNLTSNQIDALSYSGWRENLVHALDYLVVTTWGEVLSFKFHDMDGLVSAICEHLRWLPDGGKASTHAAPFIQCYALAHGANIGRRVEELFENVADWFQRPPLQARKRYVVRGGGRYYGLMAEQGSAKHDFTGTYTELLRYLSQTGGLFTDVTVDPHALDDTPLPVIYRSNAAGVVQFFFQVVRKQVHIFVLDENGALFCDSVPFFTRHALLYQYGTFFESMQYRKNSSVQLGGAGASNPRTEYCEILRDQEGAYRLSPVAASQLSIPPKFLSLQVIGAFVNGKVEFTLYCDGIEFSSQGDQGDVFTRVAHHVLRQRRNSQRYPIYITDIDLSGVPVPDARARGFESVHYLSYKKLIEHTLNTALKAIQSTRDDPQEIPADVASG